MAEFSWAVGVGHFISFHFVEQRRKGFFLYAGTCDPNWTNKFTTL